MPGRTVRYLNRDHKVFGVILAVLIVALTIARYLGLL